MYKCFICDVRSEPGQPLSRHTILRPDKSIEREVIACVVCRRDLENGITLKEALERRGKRTVPAVVPPLVNRPVTFGRPVRPGDALTLKTRT